MKVLVTGGAGLVGFHAAKYYHEQGHEVEVMDCLARSSILGHNGVKKEVIHYNANLLKEMGIKRFHQDVADRDSWAAKQGHDVVIHMAGQCGVPTSIADPRTDYNINTTGTFNVLEYCRKHDAKLVFASTNKIYPIHSGFVRNTVGGEWFLEDRLEDDRFEYGVDENVDFKGARTPYGNSKYMADLLCQEWAHTYGVKSGVFRMSCIASTHQMGFEEQGWLAWFVIATLKGWPLTIFGDGQQVRDVLAAEDAIRAYDAFIQSDINHGIWNLGGGPDNTLTLNEHVNYIEEVTGKRSEISFEDWRPLDQKWYVSDIRKIKKDLKWTPTISTDQLTDNIIEWVSDNLEVF